MKLTVKTLKQIAYQVEVPQEAKGEDLKKEIEKTQGFDAKVLKLIFNGKVVEDSHILIEMGVKEGDVIVMMNARAKPQNVNQEEKKVEEPVSQNVNKNNNMAPASDKKKKEKEKKAIPVKDYKNEIQQLKEMGFGEDMAKSAIEAAKGNLNLAIDYLYNGIPTSVNKVTDEQLYGEFFENEDEEYEEPFELNEEMLNSLDLNNPETLKHLASIVKVLIQEDPTQLSNLLMEIEEINPEIIDYIREHESEFKSLIEKPVTNEDVEAFESLIQGGHHAHLDEGDEALDEGIAGVIQDTAFLGQSGQLDASANVNLSDSDKEAIERLKNLGFSEVEAYQAYMACDKNETMAANFLFDMKLKEGGDMNVDCKH